MIATDSQSRVIEVLLEIFKEKGLGAPKLNSETVLDELGLESLDLILNARIEALLIQ